MRKMNTVSIDNFNKIRESLPESRERVLAAFYELGGKANVFEIAHHMGCEINRISGRITELKDAGLLEEYRRSSPIVNGRKRHCWTFRTTHFKNGRKRAA